MAPEDIPRDARIALRDRLRAARYAALADAEGFHEICYAIEALGLQLHGAEATLAGYWKGLRELSAHSALFGSLPRQHPEFFTQFDALYETLRRARNDAMHIGSYARHATGSAVELCIGLEDALMNSANSKLTVADYMVKSPISLELWQPVAYARQIMLAQSFSFLPVFQNKKWRLVSEMAIVGYLHQMKRSEKEVALGRAVGDAVAAGLKLLPARTVRPNDAVNSLILRAAVRATPTLWLVVESKNRLTGVLSPFELM